MTTDEKIDLILAELRVVKTDVQGLKEDVQVLKTDVQGLKEDVQVLKTDVQGLKEDVQELKTRVTNIELTLENEVGRNIKVIAEGHLNLAQELHTVYHITQDIQANQEVYEVYLKNHERKLKSIV